MTRLHRNPIVSNLEAILTDAKDGVISPENWEMLANGLRFKTALADKDKEMEAAVEDAKIAGRNEQIEKKRMKKGNRGRTSKTFNLRGSSKSQ